LEGCRRVREAERHDGIFGHGDVSLSGWTTLSPKICLILAVITSRIRVPIGDPQPLPPSLSVILEDCPLALASLIYDQFL
jgi:hypothetical protein